jgi:hypothetical protein
MVAVGATVGRLRACGVRLNLEGDGEAGLSFIGARGEAELTEGKGGGRGSRERV